MLALITQGLSNAEIADRTSLSINSIKSFIRTGYRKIDVTTRAQAVLWGVTHGFLPDRHRTPPRVTASEGVAPAQRARPAVGVVHGQVGHRRKRPRHPAQLRRLEAP